MVVCPIYQLPDKASQIYQQASSRNVCIFTYSHLAVILSFSIIAGKSKAVDLLQQIFAAIPALNPSKNAWNYWYAVNTTMLRFSDKIADLWRSEKQAAVDSVTAAKEEALLFFAQEREKIMRLSHEEALKELVRVHKIESRIKKIKSVHENQILEIS